MVHLFKQKYGERFFIPCKCQQPKEGVSCPCEKDRENIVKELNALEAKIVKNGLYFGSPIIITNQKSIKQRVVFNYFHNSPVYAVSDFLVFYSSLWTHAESEKMICDSNSENLRISLTKEIPDVIKNSFVFNLLLLLFLTIVTIVFQFTCSFHHFCRWLKYKMEDLSFKLHFRFSCLYVESDLYLEFVDFFDSTMAPFIKETLVTVLWFGYKLTILVLSLFINNLEEQISNLCGNRLYRVAYNFPQRFQECFCFCFKNRFVDCEHIHEPCRNNFYCKRDFGPNDL